MSCQTFASATATVARATSHGERNLATASPALAQFQPRLLSDSPNAERYRIEGFAGFWSPSADMLISSESLGIRADSQEFKFRVLESGIYRDFQCDRRCTYDDRAYYPATADQVKAIANATQVTVRLVGSSDANLFSSISAGISALWGPLHGGANQEVIGMLEEIRRDGLLLYP